MSSSSCSWFAKKRFEESEREVVFASKYAGDGVVWRCALPKQVGSSWCSEHEAESRAIAEAVLRGMNQQKVPLT